MTILALARLHDSRRRAQAQMYLARIAVMRAQLTAMRGTYPA